MSDTHQEGLDSNFRRPDEEGPPTREALGAPPLSPEIQEVLRAQAFAKLALDWEQEIGAE